MQLSLTKLKDCANSKLNHTIKISKSIGDKFLESEEKCLKLVNEHPKVVVFLGAIVTVVVANLANYEKNNNLDVFEKNNSTANSSFSEILENKTMKHRYPDERKSPRVHSYRLGNKVYPRGGTEQEKEAFLLDNKSLFDL